MAFLCKKCKKAFRKDMTRFEEADEFCPHCDNHFVSIVESSAQEEREGLCSVRARLTFSPSSPHSQVVDAKTPQQVIEFEAEDARVDARCVTIPSFHY